MSFLLQVRITQAEVCTSAHCIEIMGIERSDREQEWPPSDRSRKKPRFESDDEQRERSRTFASNDVVRSPNPVPAPQSKGPENSFSEGPPDADRERDHGRLRNSPRDDFAPAEPPSASPSERIAPTENVAPEGSASSGGFRLLLANLSYAATEDEIMDFFRDAGADVERADLVKVTRDNRFNGNAYIYLKNRRSVDIALDQNGREFLSRKLRVSDAQTDQLTACVRGLPPRARAADVEDLFYDCKIVDVRSRPVKGALDLNTWFVDFANEESFNRALAKDRSQPGLMICIATAQTMPRSGASRTSRDAAPMPPRVDDRRNERRDAWPDDRRQDDRDRARDPRDRSFSDHLREGHDRRLPPDDFYDGRRGVPPGLDNGAAPSYSRARSPDRYREPDRRFHDRDRRISDERDSYRDRRSSYDDRPRGYEYDRRSYRGDNRSDYRTPIGSRQGLDIDRDYRYGDRDFGGRSGGRDYYDMRDVGRPPPRSRYGSLREDADRYGDRFAPDRPLDKGITAVFTNLPFCENRQEVESHLFRTLESFENGLHVAAIYPVGRRCGACVVVFRDEGSLGRALAMQCIMINQRKVNILPLEVPSIARVQKLQPGFIPEEILDDLRCTYHVETHFVRLKQADQLLVGVKDTRYLIRLLDIDGRPLCNSRYATVSYIANRNHGEGGETYRSKREEYDEGRGDGSGSQGEREGESPPRDNDNDRWVSDREGDAHNSSRDDADAVSKRAENPANRIFATQQAMKDCVSPAFEGISGQRDMSSSVSVDRELVLSYGPQFIDDEKLKFGVGLSTSDLNRPLDRYAELFLVGLKHLGYPSLKLQKTITDVDVDVENSQMCLASEANLKRGGESQLGESLTLSHWFLSTMLCTSNSFLISGQNNFDMVRRLRGVFHSVFKFDLTMREAGIFNGDKQCGSVFDFLIDRWPQSFKLLNPSNCKSGATHATSLSDTINSGSLILGRSSENFVKVLWAKILLATSNELLKQAECSLEPVQPCSISAAKNVTGTGRATGSKINRANIGWHTEGPFCSSTVQAAS